MPWGLTSVTEKSPTFAFCGIFSREHLLLEIFGYAYGLPLTLVSNFISSQLLRTFDANDMFSALEPFDMTKTQRDVRREYSHLKYGIPVLSKKSSLNGVKPSILISIMI